MTPSAEKWEQQARYPEEIESVGATEKQEIAQEALHKTGEVAEWLFSMLK